MAQLFDHAAALLEQIDLAAVGHAQFQELPAQAVGGRGLAFEVIVLAQSPDQLVGAGLRNTEGRHDIADGDRPVPAQQQLENIDRPLNAARSGTACLSSVAYLRHVYLRSKVH